MTNRAKSNKFIRRLNRENLYQFIWQTKVFKFGDLGDLAPK